MWSFAKTHPTLIAAFGMCQILSVDRVPQIPFDSLCTVLVWSWIWKGIALKQWRGFSYYCVFHIRSLGFVVLSAIIGTILVLPDFLLAAWQKALNSFEVRAPFSRWFFILLPDYQGAWCRCSTKPWYLLLLLGGDGSSPCRDTSQQKKSLCDVLCIWILWIRLLQAHSISEKP